MQRQPEPPEDSAAAQWATSLPLFGLPESFTDLRLVGDREVSRWEERAHGRVTSGTSETFGLVHGGPPGRPGQSYLQVLSSTLPGPEPTALLTAEAERPESDNSLDDAREFAISISLDGNPVEFRGVRTAAVWACSTDFPGYAIAVIGVRWPTEDLVLVPILDVIPYVEGRNAVIAKRRRQVSEGF
jgi:hypothetical protein